MAVIIDNVYQKVLAVCNKEQRGYVTPQEFNLFADRAQNEIFNNYFHDIKMASVKPQNQMYYSDLVEMTEEKLHPFHLDATVNVVAANLTLPQIHKLISITRGNGTKVTPVNKGEIEYVRGNPLTAGSLTRSIFVREDTSTCTIYPPASVTTWNIDTSNPADGVFDAETFEVSYYKAPSTPNWAYVITGEKALYNAPESTNFELHIGEEENLVNRILMIAGVAIQKPDIQQAGMTDINMVRQQQNS